MPSRITICPGCHKPITKVDALHEEFIANIPNDPDAYISACPNNGRPNYQIMMEAKAEKRTKRGKRPKTGGRVKKYPS